LGKKAEKAAERTVERRVEKETRKSTDRVLDSVIDAPKKSKKDKKKEKKRKKDKKNKDTNVIGGDDNNAGVNNGTARGNARSTKDFVSGNKVLFLDQFLNDGIGDFPVTWNTNSSGEVITFKGSETRWLQLSNKGQFTPDGISDIPENSTFEFDLYVSDNYNFYSSGFWVNLVEVKDKRKDFTKWQRFKSGANGVRLWLHPVDAEKHKGRIGIYTYVDKSKIIENKKQSDEFTKKKNSVHISIWRQKSRIRVYIDDKKIWDLPRVFDDANYNSVVFGVENTKDEAYFYISNLRLAIAGEDTRSALLEKGRFETNEILFDVNKASIQGSSFPILKEIGQILQENPTLRLNIIGHTDSDGKTSTNQILSEERAKSVKEHLSSNFSIAESRLQTEGKGESEPIDNNSTTEGKANNRRVAFIKY